MENAGCKTAGRHAGSVTEARSYGPRRRGEPRTKEIRSQFLKTDQTRETRVPEAACEGEKSHLDNLSKTAEKKRQSAKPDRGQRGDVICRASQRPPGADVPAEPWKPGGIWERKEVSHLVLLFSPSANLPPPLGPGPCSLGCPIVASSGHNSGLVPASHAFPSLWSGPALGWQALHLC